MQKLFLILVIVLFEQNLSAQTVSACAHDEKNFRCVKYIRNYDGDTITFDIPGVHPLIGKNMAIRVNGLDTPEMRGKDTCEKTKAKEAKYALEQVLKSAKRIDLLNVSKGKYFRIVADVIVDGKSVKDLLMTKGLAYSYDGGKKAKMDWCKKISEKP